MSKVAGNMNTKHQRETPSIEQLLVGIGTAFLKAKEHFEAAESFQQKHPSQAYIIWVMAVEEIGKCILYARCLKINSNERDVNWATVRRKIEDHRSKLQTFCDSIEWMSKHSSKTGPFRFKLELDLGTQAANENLISLVRLQNSGDLKNLLHKLREYASYTVINGGGVSSPEQTIKLLPPGLAEASITLCVNAARAVDTILTEVLGPLYSQLKCHFLVTEKGEKSASYDRLVKTLNRMRPAIVHITRDWKTTPPSLENASKWTIKGIDCTGAKQLTFLVYLFRDVVRLSAGDEWLSPLIERSSA